MVDKGPLAHGTWSSGARQRMPRSVESFAGPASCLEPRFGEQNAAEGCLRVEQAADVAALSSVREALALASFAEDAASASGEPSDAALGGFEADHEIVVAFAASVVQQTAVAVPGLAGVGVAMLKLVTLEVTWKLTLELELTSEPTWRLASESAVAASASVAGAFAAVGDSGAGEPSAAGSVEVLWNGEICVAGSEEPSPLCAERTAVLAFADGASDAERRGEVEGAAAACEAAAAVGAAAAETFAGGSFEPWCCAAEPSAPLARVVVLASVVAVVDASAVVGASSVVEASGVEQHAGVPSGVEEHVVGASAVGAYVEVAFAAVESVAEEVLELSLLDLVDLEASQAGKTYSDQLALASSFAGDPSEVLSVPSAFPDALEILGLRAVGARLEVLAFAVVQA